MNLNENIGLRDYVRKDGQHGVFSDYAVADYEGNTIEVEGRLGFPSGKYKLAINNRTVDKASAIAGEFRMRGTIDSSEGSGHEVVIIVRQGFFGGTSYALEINGKPYPLSRVR